MKSDDDAFLEQAAPGTGSGALSAYPALVPVLDSLQVKAGCPDRPSDLGSRLRGSDFGNESPTSYRQEASRNRSEQSQNAAAPSAENVAVLHANDQIRLWYSELRDIEKILPRSRQIRATGATMIYVAIALGWFSTVARPTGELMWINFAAFLGVAGALIMPIFGVRNYYLRNRRLVLARRLYAHRLFIDTGGNLATYEAHSRIIIKKPRQR